MPRAAVDSLTLETLLVSTFGIAGSMADDDYMLPAKGWVNGEFANGWFNFKATLGGWSEQDNDCDDFARGAAFFAQLLNHNTPRKPKPSALAFGEFWYRQDTGDLHAINFFVYRDGTALKVGYFEPQSCSQIVLSPKEIKSCYSWRL